MKILLKFFVGVLLTVLALLIAFLWFYHEDRPVGKPGPKAEAFADSMLLAINYEGYKQLNQINWSYRNHHYQWDKKLNKVKVFWEEYMVNFSPDSLKGMATKNDVQLKGEELKDAIQTAWSYFVNDSFWLAAPFKIRDPGTQRQLVETEQGNALLVTYTSGGVTPGDAYLWFVDENYRPVAWKLWVEIIPIGGVKISWEDWQDYSNVPFASKHVGPMSYTISVENIEAF